MMEAPIEAVCCEPPAMTDGKIGANQENCGSNASSKSDPGGGAEVTANAEANAKIVYSVFKSWGMPDENIAGILSEGRNVLGMMPHPERASEALIGGEDGLVIWRSMLAYAESGTLAIGQS